LSDKWVVEMLNVMLGALAMAPVGWAVAAYAIVSAEGSESDGRVKTFARRG
jgi:hypothetical protein